MQNTELSVLSVAASAPLGLDVLTNASRADAGEVIHARLALGQSAGKGNRARRRAAVLAETLVPAALAAYWLKPQPFRYVRIRRYAMTGR